MEVRSGVTFFGTEQRKFSWFFLAVFIFFLYVPFMGHRVVRQAGDDKVYVSQAVEMARDGNWFKQTLSNEPDYYKGPAHYIFLRIGFYLFGNSMWATVYMNLIFVIMGAISLSAIVHRRMRDYDGWAFWVGASFALSLGVFSHAFASQMEVELASMFAIALYFLDKSGPGKADIKFWIIAGLAGWFKSPLHSVFLGVTAILFWGFTSELTARIKRFQAWGAVLLGILICALGYLPAFLLDRENFIQTYIFRETLWKPANGQPWHYPVIPIFSHFLFPWTLPAYVAFIDGISRLWRKSKNIRVTEGSQRVMLLGLALVIPSILFFMYHPYRGQNYNLPIIGGLLLIIGSLWATRSERWTFIYTFSIVITCGIILLVSVLLTYFADHYEPMPFWWPSWLMGAIWLGSFLTIRGLWREGFTFYQARPASMARRMIWFYWALGSLLVVLGEREMVDIRLRLQTAQANNEKFQVSYLNLKKHIWSEWGYLNFMIPHPVKGIFTEQELGAAIKRGDLILIPGDEWLDIAKQYVEKNLPGSRWEIAPWHRWKTKGKNAEGEPVWKESWKKRNLSILEKNFYMVRVFPPSFLKQ